MPLGRNRYKTESKRFSVLRLLEANPHMSQRDLTDVQGVSLGRTNDCLKALLGNGFIKFSAFARARTSRLMAIYLRLLILPKMRASRVAFWRVKLRSMTADA